MHSDLEKVDLIRSRLGVSYKEAKEALDFAEGDVVKALIHLEEGHRHFGEKFQGRVQDKSQEVMGQLKTLFQRGQDTRIKVKQGDRTVFEVPASVGALGVLGALASSELAILGALGGLTAMAKKYTLEFERVPEGAKGQGEEQGAEPHQGPTVGEA